MSSTPPSKMTDFHKLPSELIETLFSHIPPSQLQRTTYSLMQVYPDLITTQAHLFRHLNVTQAKQIKPLWYRLIKDKEENESNMVKSVETFTMGSWRADADIMNNVLRMLPDVQVLMLNLGTNVAPDHLSECFEKPRPKVQRIELRFRPYVDKASYFQFLKGVYFDSAIESLAKKWPESPSLTHLALVQDVPPRFSNPHLLTMIERLSLRGKDASVEGDSIPAGEIDMVSAEDMVETTPVEPRGYTGHSPFPYLSEALQHTKPRTFAQPICFFDIQCMSRLGRSEAGKHVTHLRLRVPTRDIAKVMSEIGDARVGRGTFPSLRYLDISTTNVRIDGWLPHLIKRYERLETLILDRTNLFGFLGTNAGPELCQELGKLCVMMGLTRSKDREREIGAWEMEQRRQAAIKERRARMQAPPRLAAVTGGGGESESEGGESENEGVAGGLVNNGAGGPILSDAPVNEALMRTAARARRGHRSMGMAGFSIRESNLRTRRGTAPVQEELELPPPTDMFIVLPPLPTLRSVCIGGEATDLTDSTVAKWDLAFHEGWQDGLQKVEDWAIRQHEKYERAVRAAQQWHIAEQQERMRTGGKAPKVKKGEAPPAAKAKVRPPLDIKLYRYPTAEESSGPLASSDNPLEGLIELTPEADWRAPYDAALENTDTFLAAAQAGVDVSELYRTYMDEPVLCMVPDCEGPMRRGEDGQRDDGRSGMIIKEGKLEEDVLHHKHAPGCGHLAGRRMWGWREG